MRLRVPLVSNSYQQGSDPCCANVIASSCILQGYDYDDYLRKLSIELSWPPNCYGHLSTPPARASPSPIPRHNHLPVADFTLGELLLAGLSGLTAEATAFSALL